MGLVLSRRCPSAERLDDPHLSPEEMRRSLEDLRLVNRRWGAAGALARHVLARLDPASSAERIRILDVGAGSGDVARSLEANLRRAGRDARVIAADVQWRHLAVGRAMARDAVGRAMAHDAVGRATARDASDRAERVGSAAADAFRLPLSDRSVDLAVSTLFFHHFSPEENAAILRELCRVARHGFAVLDVRRSAVPLAFVAVAGRLVFRARVSVEDGVASVRQAYTPEEAAEIARRVVPAARAERVFPFRFLLHGSAA
jgi:ubiquinone/menaquinone biosynthesis C-methylase UbiE